ncbi:hypothetical protein H8356DRAFT_1313155 [Neocallimastix lanati (nom. inval.)]|nr:hypothetical protein H8356DRAFT_1313155 [Neocallimastix sp. JGI-2020a]
MKFAQIALGLVAATAVLADTVSLSGDCKKAYADYEECGKTEVDGFEKIYQSDKCQNYYKDPIATLSKCGELDAETKDKLIADVKFSQAFNVLHTAKTEDGKACPLYRNKNVDKVKDTCASKSCTTASIEAYKLYVEGKKLNKNKESTIATYEEILKGLQECAPAGANDAANNSTSTVAGNSTDANANGNAAANNGTQVSVNGTNANANANSQTSGASTLKYTMALVIAAVYALF